MKNLKIILLTIIISFLVLTVICVYITRTQTFSKEANLKNIYSYDYENIKVVPLDIVNNESFDVLTSEEIAFLFDTLKNEKIKYKFYNIDKINMESKFKLRIYNNAKIIDITITPESISINGKRYITENNFMELLNNLIENHKSYLY